jgi:hypothetical protein
MIPKKDCIRIHTYARYPDSRDSENLSRLIKRRVSERTGQLLPLLPLEDLGRLLPVLPLEDPGSRLGHLRTIHGEPVPFY